MTRFSAIGQTLVDTTRYRSPSQNHNLRLGWDHFLNKTDVFGALLTAYRGNYDPGTTSRTDIFGFNAGSPDSARTAQNDRPTSSKGINLNLNYKIRLDSVRQREISMDADAGTFHYQNQNQLALRRS